MATKKQHAAPESQAPTDAGEPARESDSVEPTREDLESLEPAPGNHLLVVGVGASAGGLEALVELFDHTPAGCGLAFVVVSHLDPSRNSLLAELLGRHTSMPVAKAEEGAPVRPDHVYVIPSNRELSITDGHLHLEEPPLPRGLRRPVDTFLMSLAEDRREDGAAVILSGAGDDGSLGVRAIKEGAGIVIAQAPETAGYASMPQNAILSGVVDLVLPPGEIADALIAYRDRASHLAVRKRAEANPEQLEEQLTKVFEVVAKVTGHDFRAYKRNTLTRRAERRMALCRCDDLESYRERLERDPDEARNLFRDVLIGVTSFFRDDDAFAAIRDEVLPRILDGRPADSVARIWVAGCSTGEEAYSLAMLCKEHEDAHPGSAGVQIFATDLDDTAIAVAREGRYSIGSAGTLSVERRERFFTHEDERLRVNSAIRERIIFAQHNLLRDPPFSRLDLICCRNLLIYLEPTAQRRILPLFHQSLVPGGLLVLGNSETVGSQATLFESLDRAQKVFRRRETALPVAVDFPTRIHPTSERPTAMRQRTAPPSIDIGALADRRLMHRYAPPAVVIDEDFHIVHYATPTRAMLELPLGEPTNDILRLVREGLRPALRAAIHKAMSGREVAIYRNLPLEGDREEQVDVRVEPLDGPPGVRGLALVVFEPSSPLSSRGDSDAVDGASKATAQSDGEIVHQLEEQLRINQTLLQSAVEELETSNEELKSSNEELLSMNEELQSSNEELETSKEELQSLNEELITVNSELQNKIQLLAEANSDMQNLITSSQTATLFLDRELQLKRFTPAVARLLDLSDGDLGRAFDRIASPLADRKLLLADAAAVLETLEGREREFETPEGRHHLARILPYRTIENVIEGVVVTFHDITRLKRAEIQVRDEKALISTMMETTDALIVYLDPEFRFVAVNQSYATACKREPQDFIGRNHFDLYPNDETEQIFRGVRDTREPVFFRDRPFEFPDQPERGETFWDWSLRPVLSDSGGVRGLVLTLRETTERVRLMAELRESEYRHRIMGEVIPYGVWLTDPTGRARHISPSWCEMVGRTLEEVQDLGWLDTLVPEQRPRVQELWTRSVATGAPFEHEHRFLARDGSIRTVLARGLPIRDDEGQVTGWAGINLDITDRVRDERERAQLAEQLEEARRLEALGTLAGGVAHEFNNILTVVLGYASESLELLRSESGTDHREEVSPYLETIVNAAKRAGDLVRQIMAVGRTAEPHREVLDVSRKVEQVAAEMQRAGLGATTLNYEDLAPDCLVEVDRSQFVQILANLVANARDAVREHGSRIVVKSEHVSLDADTARHLGGIRPGEHVRLTITDDGEGIPDEIRERVFEPFFTTKPPGKGTGLGLSVVRAFVEANDGSIEVSAPEEGGTRFTLHFPAATQTTPSLPETLTGTGRPSTTGRVLYVDDEAALTRLAERYFSRLGFQIRIANGAREALQLLDSATEPFEVLITDFKMPELDGLQLIERARERHPDLRVILCSGQGDAITSSDVRRLGVDRTCTKPIEMRELARQTEELIRAGRQIRAPEEGGD